ncbi:hypothetical protein ACFL6S_35145 [Candidatus Poribacteria bacterium]
MRVSDIVRVPEIEELFPKLYNYEEIKADIAERGGSHYYRQTAKGVTACEDCESCQDATGIIA